MDTSIKFSSTEIESLIIKLKNYALKIYKYYKNNNENSENRLNTNNIYNGYEIWHTKI